MLVVPDDIFSEDYTFFVYNHSLQKSPLFLYSSLFFFSYLSLFIFIYLTLFISIYISISVPIHLLNSERKKDFFKSCASYMGGKQDVHLCLKVNKIRWECHVIFVDGLPEGIVTTRIALGFGKLCNRWRFSTRVRTRENEEADKRVIRRHVTLSTGLAPHGPGLRDIGLGCTRLAKARRI